MKDPRVYLAQILECAERITSYTREGRQRFLADRLIQDAVIRNFEIIGEAAKRVPEEYRKAHPEIPWRSQARVLESGKMEVLPQRPALPTSDLELFFDVENDPTQGLVYLFGIGIVERGRSSWMPPLPVSTASQ